MQINHKTLGSEGIKKQDENHVFIRVKLPAGVISAEQAIKVADVADKFGAGNVHLTSRGNMEIPRIKTDLLQIAYRELKMVGLELRGATGGAVRSVSCSSTLAEGFLKGQVLARKLQGHFTGNPHFEGVPKKFKIGVEACYKDVNHLIQDICLVYSGEADGENTYDVWMGGGLGKKPIEAFLYQKHLSERRILPVIEAVIEIYKEKAAAGKRLKILIQEEGRETFLQLLEERIKNRPDLPFVDAFEKHLTARPAQPGRGRIVIPVLFGQVAASALRSLGFLARKFSKGFMALTENQNITFFIADLEHESVALDALRQDGFLEDSEMKGINFRACPGNHECSRGLIDTREIGQQILDVIGENGKTLKIALTGCSNSCVRPQTTDIGVIATGNVPKFDIYQRQGESFGKVVRKGVDTENLLKFFRDLG